MRANNHLHIFTPFFFFFFLTSYNKENDFSSFNGTSRGRAKQKLCNFRRFNERRNRSGCCDDKNFQLLNKIWVPWFSIKIYTRMVTKNMVHQLSKYEMFQHEQTTIRAWTMTNTLEAAISTEINILLAKYFNIS